MTATIEYRIPPSTHRWLHEVPPDRPVAMLLRHSARPYLAPGDAGYELPLTEVGVRLATELGELLGPRLRTLHTSPLLRCMQTAEALRHGARSEIDICPDRLLGDPGVYVIDSAAGEVWRQRGHEGVMALLVRERSPLPGMAAPDEAARFLVQHMLAVGGTQAGLHVFVTHDSLVTATAAWLLGEPFGKDAWPWYLEAAFFWREGDTVHAAYREVHRPWGRGLLCGLAEGDVIEFARREVAAVLGLACPARFILAGGTFKSLLTGRPPRDLDLWAPSDGDRAILVNALVQRGACVLPLRPFGEAFEVAGRVVEVSFNTTCATLEDRLSRFDLALSAVGVEHLSGDRWRALVHPLARVSVDRREVLLLKPLVNWKHALSTLARMRRYASELGFAVPGEEEAEVWRVFDAQPREVQLDMLARLDRAAGAKGSVREEAVQRLK